jgi:hypothetical protein
MNIYERADVIAIDKELNLKDNEHFSIQLVERNEVGSVVRTDADEDPIDTYFDGYAEVYDCIIHVFIYNVSRRLVRCNEYDATITHDAICFYSNGDDEPRPMGKKRQRVKEILARR